MQYLGAKGRIAEWILDEISCGFRARIVFVDLFGGTGSVALAAQQRGYSILANDLQPYSHIVLSSLFSARRHGLLALSQQVKALDKSSNLLAGGRSSGKKLLATEQRLFEAVRLSPKANWKAYRNFCGETPLADGSEDAAKRLRVADRWNLFLNYYASTYFGVRQCLQLDALREFAQSLPVDQRTHILAAAVSTMTYAVSSTTHLAQYLKPSSESRVKSLVSRRSINILDAVAKRLVALAAQPLPPPQSGAYNLDYSLMLERVPTKGAVVYVDPPYFKEHYSRYYHVLDTFCLYDYPALTPNPRVGGTTIGRYRRDRTISDFGLKSAVRKAFSTLFTKCAANRIPVALSYANTSLVSKADILILAKAHGFSAEVKEKTLMHSGQGQPRNKNVVEYLFLFSPSR